MTGMMATEKQRITFKSGHFHGVTPDDVALWKQAYPNVDLRREFPAMRDWLESNPARMKTQWRRFITHWLSNSNARVKNGGYAAERAYKARIEYDRAKIEADKKAASEEDAKMASALSELSSDDLEALYKKCCGIWPKMFPRLGKSSHLVRLGMYSLLVNPDGRRRPVPEKPPMPPRRDTDAPQAILGDILASHEGRTT